MKTTTCAGRALATGALVATAFFISACDLSVGPPVQDIGYDHDVGPALAPATGGHKLPPDSRP